MPKLIRLYLHSIAVGAALSAGAVSLVIGGNVAGLGALLLGSPLGLMAAAMLFAALAILFSAVQFGVRVMLMAEDDGIPGGGLGDLLRPAPELVPVRVEARAQTSRNGYRPHRR